MRGYSGCICLYIEILSFFIAKRVIPKLPGPALCQRTTSSLIRSLLTLPCEGNVYRKQARGPL